MCKPYYEDPAEFRAPELRKHRDYTEAIGMAIARPGEFVAVYDETAAPGRQGAIAGNLHNLRKRLNNQYPHSFETKTKTVSGRVKGYLRVSTSVG